MDKPPCALGTRVHLGLPPIYGYISSWVKRDDGWYFTAAWSDGKHSATWMYWRESYLP